ncbi:histidine kinase [Dysgonomonas alginatilytica]|uniref:Histidine kinase n=1 Tax=Dysgonomonas alginatilytica TaxID=1605892 RepID=A0A2V3PHZ6_9BACT|nr:histidine kinase [Dysgonomonas alginatilytica]PXV58905.1 histidine kinase [Dysgonomonas alginatilytica]
MSLKFFIKIFSHILIWCIVLLVPVYIMSREGTFDNRPYISYLTQLSIFALLFYVNYLYLIDKLLFHKQFLTYVCVNIVLIAMLVGIQTIAMDFIFSSPYNDTPPPMAERGAGGSPRRHKPPLGMRIFTDYLLIVFVIGLSVAIKMTARWYRDSINLEKVKSTQLEADLRNLRSQLNPHFLFNTLNNIYSLIMIDQHKAQDSVHRLSNLLRYVLYDNDRKFVPIDKELEFTRNYIDLMKLRISSNIHLNVVIENKDSKDMVASLMFMTLIENAFKHGLSTQKDSFIDIKILVEKEKGVLCTVENSVSESNMEVRNSGIGLANLTKRLGLIYPQNHELIVERRSESFFVLLRIDFPVK